MKAGIYILIVILVLMAAVTAVAWGYPYQQAKLAPLTLSGLIVILVVVQLVREVRSRKELASEARREEKKAEPSESTLRYLLEGAWMGGFAVAIYLFGFLVAIPSFGIAYMRSHGAKWSIAIIITALMTILSWGIFSYLLGVRLYPGLIFKQLGW